jgi:lipoyl-dependent peroxiredoxin
MSTFIRSAKLRWDGDLMDGSGDVSAGSGAFTVGARFPSVAGDPPGKTTPEELLAASHATCYGIGLRSLIGQRGGRAKRVIVEAAITAEKGRDGIQIRSSHLSGVVDGLEILDDAQLQEIARDVAEKCTISRALGDTVSITHDVRLQRAA